MENAMRITSKQKKLFPFLQEKEKAGRPFTLQELADVSGYPLGPSVKAKISRGEWGSFVQQSDSPDLFLAVGTLNLSLEGFVFRISSKSRNQSLADQPLRKQTTISDDLLSKSRDEFILALELFNRPSTPNRIEAFLIHFIMAVEKLMKAKAIKELGDSALWKKDAFKRRTLSLKETMLLFFKENDPIYRNLVEIEKLRDWSVHFMLVEEVGPSASRYFQSGVFNYCKTYKDVTGKSPINLGGVGLLSLVLDGEAESKNILQLKYGLEKANAILDRIAEMDKAANDSNDISFAIPLDMRVGLLPKDSSEGHTMENLLNGRAIFIDRPRDPKLTHPYRATDIVTEVNRRLKRDFSDNQLRSLLTPRKKIEFNTDDFNSICSNEKWQSSSNSYHFDHGAQARNTYSDQVIDLIISKLITDSQYLRRVKKKNVDKRKGTAVKRSNLKSRKHTKP